MVFSFIKRSSLLIAIATAAACSMFWAVPPTPLHDAAWKGDVAAIQRLVKSGADVNATDDIGATALYWAAGGGHPFGPHRCGTEAADRPAVIAALLELGADPNLQDHRPQGMGRSSGWTPLFVALHHQQFRTARMLLEHGANPAIRSDQGMSALTMAEAEGAPADLLELIRSH